MTRKNISNAFSQKRVPTSKLSNAGYDNARENIDPHVRTKVVSTQEGSIERAPTAANHIVNKAYVDGLIPANPVTAAAALTANTVVQGNDGVRDVKTSTVTVTEIAANTAHTIGDGSDHADVATNTAKNTNVSTNLSAGTLTATTIDVNSSDGTNATLVEADTTNAGVLGSNKWDEIVAATSHVADNSQAHSDYLLNSGADVAVGPLTTTADNSTADQAFVAMVLYNTDATPPAADTVPIGTIYIQYTA